MKKRVFSSIVLSALFFIIATLSLAHFSPEKEIKTIQTLPRKPHATLDIEVTKIKTESLVASIDSKKKTITVDFYQLKTGKQNRKIVDESQYELFVFDNIDSLPVFTSKSGKSRALALKNATPKLYSYTTNDHLGKAIDIKYDELPKNLYLGVKNKNTNSVEKVYKIDDLKITPYAANNRYQSIGIITSPVLYTGGGGSNFTGAYSLANNTGGAYPISITGSTSKLTYSQYQGYSSTYPFLLWSPNSYYGSGLFYFLEGANYGTNSAGTPNYPYWVSVNGWGHNYIRFGMQLFGINNNHFYFGSNGRQDTLNTVYVGVYQWDLKEMTIQFYVDDTNTWDGRVRLTLKPTPKIYYDDTNATLKRYSASNNVFMNSILYNANLTSLSFNIGTVKFNTEDTGLMEKTPNSGFKFFPGQYNTTLGKNVIFLQDTSNNKTLVLEGIIGTGSELSTDKAARNYVLKPIGVYNGLLNNSSTTFTPTTLQIGENYKNTNAPLFQMGVASTKSYTTPFYDDIVYGSLTFPITGGTQKNTSFKLTNPIPKAQSNGTGTYKLITNNTNPNGLSTNQNTLSWTTAAINSSPGYSQYSSVHKIGVWFIDGGTTVKAASFTTDSTGKITGTTRTGTATIGGNIYRFGDFYTDGTLSLGLQSWNFATKTGVQMKVLHYTSDKDPLTAAESDAFASDTYTFNIDALTPETYYKVNAADSSLIIQNGSKTGTITNATTPIVYLGKVQIIADDRTITADTNTTPVNPSGITFTNGEVITLKGQNTGTTITGTISLSGGTTEDSTGRDLSIVLPSVFDRSDTYKTTTPVILTKLGIKATSSNPINASDIYYSIVNSITLNPPSNYKSVVRSLRLNNPIYLSPNNTSSTAGIYLFGNGTTPFTAYNSGSKHTATFTDARPNSYGMRNDSPFNVTTNVGIEGNDDLSPTQAYKYTTGLGTASNVIGRSAQGELLNNLWENYTAGLNNAFFLDNLTSKGYNTKFGNVNGVGGGIGIGITNWDYSTSKRFNVFLKDTGGRYDEQFHVYIPPFKTEAYYDNGLSTIKIDNENSDIDQSKYWSGSQGNYTYSHNHIGNQMTINATPADLLIGVKLGSIKIYDSTKVPQLPPSNRTLQFKYLTNITLVNSSGETITGDILIKNGVTTLPSPVDAATYRANLIDVYFKATTISYTTGNSTYSLTNSNLLSLGIVSDSSYDSTIIEKLSITTLPSNQKSTNITFMNPIPKGNNSNNGTFTLNGSTNPNGLSTNTNTLIWNSTPINTVNGYTNYAVTHKIGVWFEDSSEVIKAASFNTDSSGNITTLISGNKFADLNGNKYIFDFVSGKLVLGINQWNFSTKNNLKIKIIHYASNFNPLIDDESKAFDTETIYVNIDALTPSTYYNTVGTIINNDSITASIPNVQNPSVKLGTVKTIVDDKTITIDTNTPAINPFGVTFTSGETIVLRGVKNPTNTITGTISLTGDGSNDSSGRDVYLNITTSNFDRSDQYVASNKILTNLGIKATANNPTNNSDFYYSISSNLTLNPIFSNLSEITFKNPIPKGLSSGTGTFVLNGANNPTDLTTNQNTLNWITNGAPATGMTHYPTVHKIGVWITDGGVSEKVSFETDATGKLTGTKTKTLTVGGNTYIFGDFKGDGNFSLGLQNWNFAAKTGVNIKILHFDNNLDPTTAPEESAFGTDQFTVNIDALTPKTYLYEDLNDNILLHENGVEVYDLPTGINPKVYLGKVKTITDDKTITITATDTSGVTLTPIGTSITFTDTKDSSKTITGIVEIDGTSAQDTLGRDVWLQITGNPTPGEVYQNSSANLLKLGINNPNISYTLTNDITLNAPKGFVNNSEITFKNPIPKGSLSSGTGTFVLNGATNPTDLTTNQNTLNWITNGAPATGMTHYPTVHKIGVWITDGGVSEKVSFETDATGKLTGTKTKTLTVGGNTYIFGDFKGDGNFSLGLQNWNLSFKGNITMKILHFDSSFDPLVSLESDAFGKDIFTINIENFNPEIYYDINGTISKNGIQNLNVPLTVNPSLVLGTVKTTSDDNTLIESFDFHLTNTPLVFVGTINSQNTVTGYVSISDSSSQNSIGRTLTLNITSGSLKPGETYTLDNAELVRLGTPDNYYSLVNKINLITDSSFIVSYDTTPATLDFGGIIVGDTPQNEASTTLNITYASGVGSQNVSYGIKTSATTTSNIYNNFKLYVNGDTSQNTDYALSDIWLSNEVRDSSDPLKRKININGKVNDISNAQIETNSKLYQNIVEIEIKLQ